MYFNTILQMSFFLYFITYSTSYTQFNFTSNHQTSPILIVKPNATDIYISRVS